MNVCSKTRKHAVASGALLVALIVAGAAGAAWLGLETGYHKGFAFGYAAAQKASTQALGRVNSATANASLAYVKQHFPNTPFTGASADQKAPGYVHLGTAGAAPVYFDPLRHDLIVGLIINLSRHAPAQAIAAGSASKAHSAHSASEVPHGQ